MAAELHLLGQLAGASGFGLTGLGGKTPQERPIALRSAMRSQKRKTRSHYKMWSATSYIKVSVKTFGRFAISSRSRSSKLHPATSGATAVHPW